MVPDIAALIVGYACVRGCGFQGDYEVVLRHEKDCSFEVNDSGAAPSPPTAAAESADRSPSARTTPIHQAHDQEPTESRVDATRPPTATEIQLQPTPRQPYRPINIVDETLLHMAKRRSSAKRKSSAEVPPSS